MCFGQYWPMAVWMIGSKRASSSQSTAVEELVIGAPVLMLAVVKAD
jgi:hypothetical protein